MGILDVFGGGEKKSPAKVCPNCGKPLEGVKTVWRQDGHYCCDKCCEAGPRIEEKKKQGKSLTCEFC